MSRFVTLAMKLAPLVKQAWPILAAIVAVLVDAFGATGGAATAGTVGILAGTQVVGAGRRLDAVDALAAPLRPLGDVVEVPVFEFHADRKTGRTRAVAISLHGRRYGLETGPGLYLDATAPAWDAEDESAWDDEDLDLDDETLDDEPTPDRT